MSKFIKYGDLVVVNYNNIQSKEPGIVNNQPLFGYIAGTGFLNNTLYFQTVCESNWSNSAKNLQEDGTADYIPNVVNYRDFVFQICPKLNSEFHRDYEYAKNKQFAFKKRNKEAGNELDDSKKHILDALEVKLAKTQVRMQKEKEYNNIVMKQYRGMMLTYGAEIQLIQYDSSNFITVMNECSYNQDKIGHDVQLDDYYSTGMVFKVVSKYKIKQHGDYIFYNDSILLFAVGNPSYLSFTSTHLNIKKKLKHHDGQHFFRTSTKSYSKNSYQYPLYSSQTTERSWRFQKYSNYRKGNEPEIMGQDIVKLLYSETQTFMCADLCYMGKNPEVYLRKYNGELAHEECGPSCLWEVDTLSMFNRGKKLRIKESDELPGIHLADKIRLRHFVTGRLQKFESEGNSNFISLSKLKKDSKDEYQEIQLEPLERDMEYAVSNKSYFIRSKKDIIGMTDGILLSRDIIINKIKEFKIDQQKNLAVSLLGKPVENNFYPIDNSIFDETRTTIGYDNIVSNDMGFLIEKISNEERSHILFARSGIKTIKKFVQSFQKIGAKDEMVPPGNESYTQVTIILKKILCFIFLEKYTPEFKVEEVCGEPDPYRQSQLKSMGYFEIQTDLLFFPIHHGYHSFEDLKPDMYITSVLTESYNSIRYISQEYRPNELYASQWLQLVIEQSLNTSELNDINASATLTELMDNNKTVLKTRIDSALVKRFIDYLIEKDKDADYLNILSVMCICNGAALIKNQKELCKQLLGEKEVFEKIYVPQRESEDVGNQEEKVTNNVFVKQVKSGVEIFVEEEKIWVDLKDIKENSPNSNIQKLHGYLVALIKLFANMCFNKNQLGIDALQKIQPYNLCCKAVVSERVDYEIRAAFIMVLRDIWINTSLYYEIKVPNCLKIWDKLTGNIGVTSTHHSTEKYESLKSYILNYLSNCQDRLRRNLANEPYILVLILELLYYMFKLGFIKEVSDINQILNYIKNQLLFDRNSVNMTDNNSTISEAMRGLINKNLKPEDLEENNQKSMEIDQLIADAKCTTCMILKYIQELQNDLRCQVFCSRLKNLITENDKSLDQSINFNKSIKKSKLKDSKDKISDNINDISQRQGLLEDDEDLDLSETMNDKIRKISEKVLNEDNLISFGKTDNLQKLLYSINGFSDNNLITEVMDYVNKIHMNHTRLRETQVTLQFITEEHIKDYNNANKLFDIMVELFQSKEKWFGDIYGSDTEKVENGVYEVANKIKVRAQEIGIKYNEHSNSMGNGDMNGSGVHSNGETKNANTHEQNGKTLSEENKDFSYTTIYILETNIFEINIFYQDLYRNLGFYDNFFDLLEYDIETFSEDNTTPNPELIRKIYTCQALAAKKNLVNKFLFNKYLRTVIVPHIKCEQDFGTHLQLHEMIEGNKDLLLDEKTVEWLLDEITANISNLYLGNILKSFALKTLSKFIKYDNYVLKNNQNFIITKILANDNNGGLIVQFKANQFKLAQQNEVKSYKAYYDYKRERYCVIINNIVCYYIAFLDLATDAAEGKNAFSENFGQNLITINDISEMIHIVDQPVCFKLSLLKFLFHVYLDVEKEMPHNLIEVLIDISEDLLQEYNTTLDMLTANKSGVLTEDNEPISLKDADILTHKSLIKMDQLMFDYLESLLECFCAIIPNSLQVSKETPAWEKFKATQIHFKAMVKRSYSKIDDKSLVNLLQKIDFYSTYNEESDNFEPSASLFRVFEKVQEVDQKPIDLNLKTSSIQRKMNRGDGKFKELARRNCSFRQFIINNPQDQQIAYAQQSVHNYLTLKTTFIGCEEEFESWIKEINSYQYEAFKGEYKYGNLQKSLINYYYENCGNLSSELLDAGLRLLIEYIGDPEDEDCQAQDDLGIPKIKVKQDFLIDSGVIDLIFKIVKEPKLEEIIKERVIYLSIQQLFLGNNDGQMAYYQAFKKDEYNVFLRNLMQILTKNFEDIESCMRDKNEFELKKIMNEKDDDLEDIQSNKSNSRKVSINIEESNAVDQNTREIKEGVQTINNVQDEISNISDDLIVCSRIFNFCQLLCEGHNQTLQDALRQQDFRTSRSLSFTNVNFIRFCSNLLDKFLKIVNPVDIEMGYFLIDLLVEAVQGPCLENQKELFDQKVVDFIKDFQNDVDQQSEYFKHVFIEDESKQSLLIKKLIKLLSAQIEANDNKNLLAFLRRHLNIDFLIITLTLEYELYMQKFTDGLKSKSAYRKAEKVTKFSDVFDTDLIEAFDIYFFIETINTFSLRYESSRFYHTSKFSSLQRQAWNFFKTNSAHIEIIFNDNIEKYYFPIQPANNFVDPEWNIKFLDQCKRNSPSEKLTDFQGQVNMLLDQMDHMVKLRTGKYGISIHPNILVIMRLVYFALALGINLIMMTDFEAKIEDTKAEIHNGLYNNWTLISFLGYSQVFISTITVILWFFVFGPPCVMSGYRDLFKEYKKELLNDTNKKNKTKFMIGLLSKNYTDIADKQKFEIIHFMNERHKVRFPITKLWFYANMASFIMKDGLFAFQLFVLVMAVLSSINNFILLYSVMLLDFINYFKDLETVISSVTRPINQFIVVTFLFMIINYIYALFGYFFLSDQYFDGGSGENYGENMCTTVSECFLTLLSWAMRSSGGIGDQMKRMAYNEDNYERYYIRYFYDLSCFITLNLIMMNVIFGIIIDTFAQLRNEKKALALDKENVCFICSLEKDKFEKVEGGWSGHMFEDHNVLDYLAFLYHLKSKDVNDMTGIETVVYSKLKEEDISWIPVSRSLSLIDSVDPAEEWNPLLDELKGITDKKIHEILKSGVIKD